MAWQDVQQFLQAANRDEIIRLVPLSLVNIRTQAGNPTGNFRVYFDGGENEITGKRVTGISIVPKLILNQFLAPLTKVMTEAVLKTFVITFNDTLNNTIIDGAPLMLFSQDSTKGRIRRCNIKIDLTKSYITRYDTATLFVGSDVIPFVFYYRNN